MGNIHVVNRANAIIHWLERLKKSYSDGDTNGAYIEAECARADIEALTHDFIAGLSHTSHRHYTSYLADLVRMFALSLAIVMSWAIPISRDKPNTKIVSDPSLTRDNPIVVSITRPTPVNVPNQPSKSSRRKTQKSPLKPSVVRKPQPPVTAPPPTKMPAYDSLPHLTLTGQKALSNKSITKIKTEGKL